MDTKPRDISPDVREFLRLLKSRPGMYLGKESLNALWHFLNGIIFYKDAFDKGSDRVIIPDGFTDFVEKYYGEHWTFNHFHYVLHFENDDKKALFKWFELLDEYLISLGYEPLGKREDIIEELHNKSINNSDKK